MNQDFSDLILDAAPPPPTMIPAPLVAGAYFRGGWHPVPFKPGHKATYMQGVTGRYGKNLSLETLSKIALDDGLGLRMPQGVIGIDVDAYHDGGDGWRELIAQLGEPGPSYRSSARMDDSISGIRYYTVPLGLKIPAGYKPAHIDFIRHGHRAATVYPSVHAKTGQVYRWWDEQGNLAEIDDSGFDIPFVEELHELSPSWVNWIQELSSVGVERDVRAGDSHITTCNSFVPVREMDDEDVRDSHITTCNSFYTDAYTTGLLQFDNVTDGRRWAIVELARDGRYKELRGDSLEDQTRREIAGHWNALSFAEAHGQDELDKAIRSGREYADGHYNPLAGPSPFKTILNRNQLLHRMELVAADHRMRPAYREAFMVYATYCHDRDYYYGQVCTRALALVLKTSSVNVSRYMHRWEDNGHGLLKVGTKGEGNTKDSSRFYFALDDLPTTAPANPTVDLNDYRDRANDISRYWEK